MALAYDQATSHMRFAFSTSGPSGRHYDAGRPSVFNIPARTYPNGWHVTIAGGTVVEAGDTSRLAVVAQAGATCVTVIVDPGPAPPVIGPSNPADCPAAPARTTTTTTTTTIGPATPAEPVRQVAHFTG